MTWASVSLAFGESARPRANGVSRFQPALPSNLHRLFLPLTRPPYYLNPTQPTCPPRVTPSYVCSQLTRTRRSAARLSSPSANRSPPCSTTARSTTSSSLSTTLSSLRASTTSTSRSTTAASARATFTPSRAPPAGARSSFRSVSPLSASEAPLHPPGVRVFGTCCSQDADSARLPSLTRSRCRSSSATSASLLLTLVTPMLGH